MNPSRRDTAKGRTMTTVPRRRSTTHAPRAQGSTRTRLSRILVVEDNATELRLILDLLCSEGFDAFGCTTASEALEHVATEEVGVAVVDLRLPDLSGTRLLELLRAKREAIRVIIYTGQASYESAKEALNSGAFAYVEKAGDPGELLRQVHRALWNNIDQYAVELERGISERDDAQGALQHAHDLLENRVRQRTSARDSANQALEAEIQERRQAEAQVRARLRYEEGLASCSQVLLGTFDKPEALSRAIKPLLSASGASRVYVFENFEDRGHGLCMRHLASLCRPGIRSDLGHSLLQHLPYNRVSRRLRDQLSNGEWYGGGLTALPAEDRVILESQGIRSILILPIQTHGQWFGFIGFDDCRREHLWSEHDINLLHTAAKIVGVYLEWKQAQAKERAYQDLFESLSRIQSQFIAEADPECTLNRLLKEVLSLTKSEYGFIGETVPTEEGTPRLRIWAVSSSASTGQAPAAFQGLAPGVVVEDQDPFFRQLRTTRQPLITTCASPESSVGNSPGEQPARYGCLGLPLFRGDQFVGMIGIARRPGGYRQADVEYLQPYLATCANIIEAFRNDRLRRSAQEALREREQQLLQALEDREALSQDLHDGVLQSLYAVGLGLEACKPLVFRDTSKASEQIAQAISQLNSVMREVRHFITGLDSEMLQVKDFTTTLEKMLSKLDRIHSMQVRLSVDPAVVRRLTRKQAMHLLYIVQEGLSNSLRHGRAKTGVISLRARNGTMRLQLKDDGVGFEVDAVRGHGHGLANMVSRARKLGGTFSIASRPGRGTRISLTMKTPG